MVSKKWLIDDEQISNMRIRNFDLSINELARLIEQSCINIGLNASVTVDKADSGRLFDKNTTDCIVIASREHPEDYYQNVILVTKTGPYGIVEFYLQGESKNGRKIHNGEREHSTITGMIFGAIQKATVSEKDRLDEETYYQMVTDAIHDVFNALCYD